MNKLDVNRSLLLLIDWQSRLLPALRQGAQALERSCRLASAAKLLTVPVLVTEHCADKLGTTDEALLSAAAQPQILHKASFSAFNDGGLREALATQSRRQLVVSGAEAHVCVMQTVLDLLEAQWAVFVVVDAVASRRKQDYKTALARMQQAGAVLVTSEMVLFEWQARADSPTFKPLLAMLR